LQDPSGLDYFHARYYDPVVGQFVSEDTVQGPNRYAYVAGNPETNTDPTGQFMMGMCGGMALADGVCWRAVEKFFPKEANSVDPYANPNNDGSDNSRMACYTDNCPLMPATTQTDHHTHNVHKTHRAQRQHQAQDSTPDSSQINQEATDLGDLADGLAAWGAVFLGAAAIFTLIGAALVGWIAGLLSNIFTFAAGVAAAALSASVLAAIITIGVGMVAMGTAMLVAASQVNNYTRHTEDPSKWTSSALQSFDEQLDGEIIETWLGYSGVAGAIGVVLAFGPVKAVGGGIIVGDIMSEVLEGIAVTNITFGIDNSFGAAEAVAGN
jgi:hypothetical protein